jgi:hypothetical protein
MTRLPLTAHRVEVARDCTATGKRLKGSPLPGYSTLGASGQPESFSGRGTLWQRKNSGSVTRSGNQLCSTALQRRSPRVSAWTAIISNRTLNGYLSEEPNQTPSAPN